MFTLGLEFSVRKLREVGVGVLAVAVAEVGLMLWIGVGIGGLFGWKGMDALFLGAIIALSSTMVATRTLSEGGQRHQPFARLVVGLLVAEDMLTIVMLTLLTAVAIGGSVQAQTAFTLIGHLGLFMVAGMILGLLLLPRLVDYVAGFGRDETLLVSVLGICFGASLLAVWMGFSVALGAFLAGAVVAESRSVGRVLRLIEPLRDMFAALFFVAIGLKIDPAMLMPYALPALLIAGVVIIGKTVICSLGIFIVGHDARTALRSGLSMAQIGEFSFVIATLGLSLGVISKFIYPIAVAVSVLCMAASPYLTRSADRLANGLRHVTPRSIRLLATSYSGWLENLKPVNENAALAAIFRRLLWHIAINVLLVVTLFMIGAYVNSHNWDWFSMFGIGRDLRHTLIWASALFLSLPILTAVYRKAEALGMLLAELGIRERFAGSYTQAIRQVLARVIPLATLLALALLVSVLGSTILPPRGVALSLVLLGLALAVALWRGLVQMHARLQAALKETLDKPESPRSGPG
jgi:CPA2 family monovalent cation:H+ antiporter-2